jgi:glycosyltransferase involved in cell wall biosynthesis
MTVSIIIPVYNDQVGLNQTLNAIDGQNFPLADVEVIIVDNGSTDKVFLEKSYQFTCIVLSENKPGSYSARNKGLEFSAGEIVVFTDANCIPDPEWLKSGISRLTTSAEGLSIIGGYVELFDPNYKSSVASSYDMYTGFGQKKNVEARGFSATANLFTFREVFSSVGVFNSHLLSAGDFEWCWRAQAAGYKLGYEHKASMLHPCRTSLVSLIRQARRVEGGRRQLAQYFYTSDYSEPKSLNKRTSLKGENRFKAALSILQDSTLNLSQKINVLVVGSILRISSLFERFRLSLGQQAERE